MEKSASKIFKVVSKIMEHDDNVKINKHNLIRTTEI